ncbi:hypothetical protein [Nocardia arthritidis]|uniref:Uncharacterized protein n=1 Tax=Nocardia arthritidis TaxID=228602 RepID=A0A6G9YH62_9NOCA|nr:hypothetical protein [Nocardia arthritidis]QIS12524.1 hypothetical protein F5544_23325 [Nocardia arthritidis]
MTYTANLDFGKAFGASPVCPGCGAEDVFIADGQSDVLFRCRNCGMQWHVPHEYEHQPQPIAG